MILIAFGLIGAAPVLGVALVVSVNIMADKQVEAMTKGCHSQDELHAPTDRADCWLDPLNPSKAEAYGGNLIPLVDPEEENDDNVHADRHAHWGLPGLNICAGMDTTIGNRVRVAERSCTLIPISTRGLFHQPLRMRRVSCTWNTFDEQRAGGFVPVAVRAGVTKMTMRRKIASITTFLTFFQFGASLPRPPNTTVTLLITFAIFLVPGIIGLFIAIARALF